MSLLIFFTTSPLESLERNKLVGCIYFLYLMWMQVIKLLQREGIEWSEENQGVLLIKLNGCREFSFLNSESDTE